MAWPIVALAGTPDSIGAEYGHHLLRRWYGVQPWDQTAEKDPRRITPCPITCQNPVEQPVRYCFRDKRSAKNLGEIVDKAVVGWSHAMVHSALRIQLDPGTGGDPEITCADERVAKDALVISDETRDGDEDYNLGPDCPTAATLGYQFIPEGRPTLPFRHRLRFCGYLADNEHRTKESAVRQMMHELGHVIGLAHEHQRPDRDEHIKFMCKRLWGYDEALEAAMKDEQGMMYDSEDESDDEETRVLKICNYPYYAKAYFPQALDYIRGDRFRGDEEEQIWKNRQFSDKFDFDSIMIYSSSDLAKEEEKRPMVRRSDRSDFYMGGSPDDDKVSISAGDIARVAQLYDNGTPECKQAQDGGNWGPVKITIRDVVEERVMPPWMGKRDEL
ncbi:hypothetical protein PRZ48_003295 [Zasmidium cellare]|uniref:Metalloendopeptidase n=1 Tax=Zasmidium cellare TaxID=395010 RepID=A0ABR0EUQ7_ZASCE|nr:hypothetical protein PRZ48_003295 [Zasmidium cellare]